VDSPTAGLHAFGVRSERRCPVRSHGTNHRSVPSARRPPVASQTLLGAPIEQPGDTLRESRPQGRHHHHPLPDPPIRPLSRLSPSPGKRPIRSSKRSVEASSRLRRSFPLVLRGVRDRYLALDLKSASSGSVPVKATKEEVVKRMFVTSGSTDHHSDGDPLRRRNRRRGHARHRRGGISSPTARR
jgi:hypothetical protein